MPYTRYVVANTMIVLVYSPWYHVGCLLPGSAISSGAPEAEGHCCCTLPPCCDSSCLLLSLALRQVLIGTPVMLHFPPGIMTCQAGRSQVTAGSKQVQQGGLWRGCRASGILSVCT